MSLFFVTAAALAEVKVESGQVNVGSGFVFENLASPAINDAGRSATWSLNEGEADQAGAGIEVLGDGKVPMLDDQPRSNFFFVAGSDGGTVLADLGEVIDVSRISTFSRHNGDRAPQVYTIYGSDGKADGFDIKQNRKAKPEHPGWREIASIDTRPTDGDSGGRYGVEITETDGTLGMFRYLLFEIQPTEKRDRFGLTFFSEIDIVEADGPELEFVPAGKPLKVFKFESEDGRFEFLIDSTDADDLHEWSKTKLAPVIKEWYPKIVEILKSEGYEAPQKVSLHFRDGMNKSVPAMAMHSRIYLNTPWFREQLKGQAKGCVVHELVHVVQNYWLARRINPQGARTPGWFVEGLADYIRWFLYEPHSRGALLSVKQLEFAKHDASYGTSANFLDWVSRTHGVEVIQKLNAAARSGKYDEELWEKYTGKPISNLADDWREEK